MAACGGGSVSSSTTTAPTTTMDVAAATAQVTTLFETVFHETGQPRPASTLEATVEDGTDPALAPIFQAQASATTVTSIKVRSVSILSAGDCAVALETPPCAAVVFDLYLTPDASGTPVLPNQTKYAVLRNGKWLVSRNSLCDLVALGAPPHCPVSASQGGASTTAAH